MAKKKNQQPNWQSVPLDFFKEIMNDYFKKESSTYKDIIIEIKTSEENKDRLFMDNTSYKETGGQGFIKSFMSIAEDAGRKELVEMLDLDRMIKNLVGSVVMVKKEKDLNPLIKIAQDLLKDRVNLLEKGVDDDVLKNLSKTISDVVAPVEYPLTTDYLNDFLFEGLIISVPPNHTNIAGTRPEPLWFLKKDGKEIEGDDLKEEDWKSKLSDKYIKIRSFTYSDFKENILGKMGE